MTLFRLAILACAVAGPAIVGGPALAQAESPIALAVANDTADRSGFYTGLQWGRGNIDVRDEDDTGEADIDGIGFHFGYLRDLGTLTLGGEFSYDRISANDNDVSLLRLRTRVGADLGKFMPYASLGLGRLTEDGGENGFVYGIGAEYMVTDRFVLGAEYSRVDFGEIDDSDIEAELDLVQIRASFRF